MTSQSGASSERSGSRDLRAELLRTSRKLLDESGPSALSMREVARRAGCTHQAPYHYFANREAILAALVREGFDELADRLASAREGLEGMDRRAMSWPAWRDMWPARKRPSRSRCSSGPACTAWPRCCSTAHWWARSARSRSASSSPVGLWV